jgi:hypothetical protein
LVTDLNRTYGFAFLAAIALAAAVLAGCVASPGDNGASQITQLNQSLQAAISNSTSLADQVAQEQSQVQSSQQQYQQASTQLSAAQTQLAAQNATEKAQLQAILVALNGTSTNSSATTFQDLQGNYTATDDYACPSYFSYGYGGNGVTVPPQCVYTFANLLQALQGYLKQGAPGTSAQASALVQSDLNGLSTNSTS